MLPEFSYTHHAQLRIAQRRITTNDIQTTLIYGRCVHERGALIYVIGHKEAEAALGEGLDLFDLEGVHVICSPFGFILTAYRNRTLNLRPTHHRRGRGTASKTRRSPRGAGR